MPREPWPAGGEMKVPAVLALPIISFTQTCAHNECLSAHSPGSISMHLSVKVHKRTLARVVIHYYFFYHHHYPVYILLFLEQVSILYPVLRYPLGKTSRTFHSELLLYKMFITWQFSQVNVIRSSLEASVKCSPLIPDIPLPLS